MEKLKSPNSERSKRITAGTRLFLAALTLTASIMPRTTQASPMVDGPQVCSVDGSIIPTLRNPDPLNTCPPTGELIRLPVGDATINYIETYYPYGTDAGPVLPDLAEDPHSKRTLHTPMNTAFQP